MTQKLDVVFQISQHARVIPRSILGVVVNERWKTVLPFTSCAASASFSLTPHLLRRAAMTPSVAKYAPLR